MATLIKTDKTQTTVTPANGMTFTIQELYTLLDCLSIEVIPTNTRFWGVLDEHSKINDKRMNSTATSMCSQHLTYGDYIAGDMAVMTDMELNG